MYASSTACRQASIKRLYASSGASYSAEAHHASIFEVDDAFFCAAQRLATNTLHSTRTPQEPLSWERGPTGARGRERRQQEATLPVSGAATLLVLSKRTPVMEPFSILRTVF